MLPTVVIHAPCGHEIGSGARWKNHLTDFGTASASRRSRTTCCGASSASWSAISILLPLTFGMKPVAAILMPAGIFYGAQYGGAICSIPLNLPCHPPHAVTCLDGYPLTRRH